MTEAVGEGGLEVSLHQERPMRLAAEFCCLPGEITALIGPSGSGKTSILRAIAGLARPARGRILCAGRVWLDTVRGLALSPQARRVGLVFQDYALFPHLDARGNVLQALGHLPRRQRRARAEVLLARMRLAGLERRLPGELSGGQRQRVALARALAREPAALLLDEPFSAVDPLTRRQLQEELARLHRRLPVPLLLVTHDLSEASLLADRLVVLHHGQTRQSGSPQAVVTRPADREVARLVGQRNVFRGRILARDPLHPGRLRLDWDGLELGVEGAAVAWKPATVVDWLIPASAILWQRPDRPRAGDRENPVRGRVAEFLVLGDNCALTLVADRPAGQCLRFSVPLHVTRRHGLAAGDRATVSLLANAIHLMPAQADSRPALDWEAGSAPFGQEP